LGKHKGEQTVLAFHETLKELHSKFLSKCTFKPRFETILRSTIKGPEILKEALWPMWAQRSGKFRVSLPTGKSFHSAAFFPPTTFRE